MKEKLRHGRREQIMNTKWGKGGGGMNWEIGIDMYTLLKQSISR